MSHPTTGANEAAAAWTKDPLLAAPHGLKQPQVRSATTLTVSRDDIKPNQLNAQDAGGLYTNGLYANGLHGSAVTLTATVPVPRAAGNAGATGPAATATTSAAAIPATTASPAPQPFNPSQVCYGRVRNMEAMVPPQWWKTVFADGLYLQTDGDVVEDADITRAEVDMIEAVPAVAAMLAASRDGQAAQGITAMKPLVGASPAHQLRVLDLCCGQGRHSIELARRHPEALFCGHDQSGYLVNLARERAQLSDKAAHNTRFTEGDCRHVPYPNGAFDIILLMGNSFGYFTDVNGDSEVLKEARRLLAPSGVMLLDLVDGDHMRENYAQRSWEWVDDTTFVCRERKLSDDKSRLTSREVVTVTNRGVIRDQFYAERLYSQSDITTLLAECGLTSSPAEATSTFITLFNTSSKRGEDLGMMSPRMLVVSFASDPSATFPMPQHLRDAEANIHRDEQGRIISPSAASSNDASAALSTASTIHALALPTSSLATGQPAQVCAMLPLQKLTVIFGDSSVPCIGKLNDTWNPEDFESRNKLLQALEILGYRDVQVLDHHPTLLSSLAIDPPQLVLNLCDEGFGNDAQHELHVPALLDMLNIPYTGAGPNSLSKCFDKSLVNAVARGLGIPTPREAIVPETSRIDVAQVRDAVGGYPAFIKPIRGDNSLGITMQSIVHTDSELLAYLEQLRAQDITGVLVQEYLQGTEYGLGMLGNPGHGFHFFPILEVDFSDIVAQDLPPILGYESKWDPTSAYWTSIKYRRSHSIGPDVERQMQENCKLLWKQLDCVDYCRFDFRADKDGIVKLLEVNPNPGWVWDGKLAYMAGFENKSYADMIGMTLDAAVKRI
ncbi:hypothetical protein CAUPRSCDRAFT_7151, partial [Caulochytrium protostelioides]